ncbi:MAG: signal peptidase I [Clostridiales bacterium]|nr:signal peptidase I [Clostridiales bacterium]
MAENMGSMQENTEEEHSIKLEIYDWMQCIVVALVACILIFTFVGRIIGVDGSSMVPTLEDGDKIIITNIHGELKYGDVVVLTKREFSREPIVKRVIATEGQTLDINFQTGEVWVDGQLLDEPYINAPTMRQLDVEFPVTVPEGCIFVMGDNRNKSTDSRASTIGFVDTRCVLGKALNIVYPFSHFGIIK